MSIDWLWFANVTTFAVVASQHAFYAVGLGRTQCALGASAYVELRNAIDDVLRKSLPPVYLATLACAVLSVIVHDGAARGFAVLALAALGVEAWLMLKRSVPINARMQTWTPDAVPADWQETRSEWLAVFAQRQVAVAIGFTATLLGALVH
jgi:hypothetical protein